MRRAISEGTEMGHPALARSGLGRGWRKTELAVSVGPWAHLVAHSTQQAD